MAYQLIWSPASRDDLRDIVSSRSRAFGMRPGESQTFSQFTEAVDPG
jgi:hypothetical protein